jgi:hypothetical protein
MLITARIMLNRTIHAVSGPAPTTIGNGPMKITAPKLAEPPPESTAATKTTIMPTKTKIKPKIKNRKNLLGTAASSATVWDFSSAFLLVPIHLNNK